MLIGAATEDGVTDGISAAIRRALSAEVVAGVWAHAPLPARIERRLGLREKAIITAVRAAYGEYRPWLQIREWAAGIGRQFAAA